MNKLYYLFIIVLFISCDSNKSKYDPYSIKDNKKTETVKSTFEVDFKKTDANLKTIHIRLNDANGYDVLFDTGCSGMSISKLEYAELMKSGTLTDDDYVRTIKTHVADGSIIETPVYNIRSITIVDKNGKKHIIRDIKATMVENPIAPILIGNAVIDNLAKKSYTVDLNKKVIRFK